MTGPIDIREPFYDLCARLGLKADEVQQLTVWPGQSMVGVYKDSDSDIGADDVVADVLVFEATTQAAVTWNKTFNPWMTTPREDRNGRGA